MANIGYNINGPANAAIGAAQDVYNKNNYTYAANGNGGLNYFFSGKPITNVQYGQATGADYNKLQREAAASFLGQAAQAGASRASSSSAAASTIDPSAAAGYDSQANSYQQQLGQLDPALQTSLSNLQNQRNSAYNSAQDQFGKATRD